MFSTKLRVNKTYQTAEYASDIYLDDVPSVSYVQDRQNWTWKKTGMIKTNCNCLHLNLKIYLYNNMYTCLIVI